MQAFLGVYNADAPKEEQATLDDPLFQGAFGLFNSMFGTADSKRDLDTRLKHRLDVEKGLTDMLFRETVLVPVEPIQPRETPFFVGH